MRKERLWKKKNFLAKKPEATVQKKYHCIVPDGGQQTIITNLIANGLVCG